MNFAAEVPLNNLSFGQSSVAILREFYEQGLNPVIKPIGPKDISSQKNDDGFNNWLAQNENNFVNHRRTDPVFRLWHPTSDLFSQISDKQISLVFHETNQLTQEEINILSQQSKVLVTSKFTKEVFETFGLENVIYCPLGFDKYNFYPTQVSKIEGVTSWGILQKWEERKATSRIINIWKKKYGGNPGHRLTCLTYNGFISPEHNQALMNQALDGEQVWNIRFLPYLKTNFEMNQLLNSIDINLSGLSLMEGFNLPAFHSLCLDKLTIFLDAHVHKDYATAENSVLVKPSGFKEASDGLWFVPGRLGLQGYWFDFNPQDVWNAMSEAEKKIGFNKDGERLRETFSYKNTTNIIQKTLESL